jgi:hypothetical protein
MTIEALVEEMEENEDMVECKWCEELFSKEDGRFEMGFGGLICPSCQNAAYSRGERMTYRTTDYWDFLDEDMNTANDLWSDRTIALEYENLDIEPFGQSYCVSDYEYLEDAIDVFEVLLHNNYLSDDDVKDFPGGLKRLQDVYGIEDDAAVDAFLNAKLDVLVNKYYTIILDYFEERAKERATTYYEENPPEDLNIPDEGPGKGAFSSEADFRRYKG